MNRIQRILSSLETINISKKGHYPYGNLSDLLKKSMDESYMVEPIDFEKLENNTEWNQFNCPTSVAVVNDDVVTSIIEARTLNPESKIAVLNFASPLNPCGGFRNGFLAQEEAIAYASNLYTILKQKKFSNFYNYFYNYYSKFYPNRMIYAKDVVFFKDTTHDFISTPVTVDVITAPAVNAGSFVNVIKKTTPEEIRMAMEERIRSIFILAAANKVDVLILGAFGCGVFKNNPAHVREAFQKQLNHKRFNQAFHAITFSILESKEHDLIREFKKLENVNNKQKEG